MALIRARAYVQAGRPTVLRVLHDYERFEQWVPGVDESSLLAVEDDVSFVELSGPQLGHGPLLLELKGGDALEARRVGRFRRRGARLQLEVDEREDSAGSEVRLRLHDGLPRFRGFFRRRRVRALVEETLHALDVRAQKAASGWLTEGSTRSKKVLEVRREDGGLAVSFRGETFHLQSQTEEAEP